MSAPTHSDSSNDQFGNVLSVINHLAQKSADGDYIYRGEPKHYEKVSSSLYRQYQEIDAKGFDIEAVQKEMLKEASRYTSQTDESEILAELQHYGGNTNLIDCTTDSLIALFFACNGVADKDGRVVLLKKSDDENKRIWQPKNPSNRVIAQKSIFVQPKKGFVEPDDEIEIPKSLKQPLLNHIRKCHGISTETIYNDLHGFIKNQNIHQSAYTEFAWGLTCQNQDDNKKAIEHYSKALELDPQHVGAYNNRGVAFHDTGDHDRAIQDYDKAIALMSDHLNAYNNPGNVYAQKGESGQAMQDYAKATKLRWDCANVYYRRGVTWLLLKEWDKAGSDFIAARNRGLDIAKFFSSNSGSVSNFEQQYHVQLPKDIAAMLTS